MDLYLYIIIFIYGVVIGSFVNVCIYRIPEEQSIIFGKSHCFHCNTDLKWYDLIPLFSYLALGGRCRNCRNKISLQYPAIELMNGLLYIWIFYVNGLNCASIIYCLVASTLLIITVIDIRTQTINQGLNIFIFLLGLIILGLEFAVSRDTLLLLDNIIGLFAISGPLLLLYIVSKGKGIGMGDIKLMAAAGLVLGWKLIILAFFLGCILGAIIHLVIMAISKRDRVLAFGPYLSAGIFLSLLYGDAFIRWYLDTMF